LREICDKHGILLIFDEVITGFGRMGTNFASDYYGVVPDMLTIAKPLANGLPIGAILVNDAVARTMKPGDHGTTFGGGPLLAHVAHHVVQRLSDPTLLQHVRETGAWFGEQLQGIADRTGQVRAIRGTGLMWGMDVHEPAAAIIGRAFEKGLLLVSAGEHTLRFLPPLVITKAELAEGLAILESVMGA
jgi:acetylornithine/N-succinyldiaminopimelate aminotransferase